MWDDGDHGKTAQTAAAHGQAWGSAGAVVGAVGQSRGDV